MSEIMTGGLVEQYLTIGAYLERYRPGILEDVQERALGEALAADISWLHETLDAFNVARRFLTGTGEEVFHIFLLEWAFCPVRE